MSKAVAYSEWFCNNSKQCVSTKHGAEATAAAVAAAAATTTCAKHQTAAVAVPQHKAVMLSQVSYYGDSVI
jgi:hypothetical protein